MESSESISLVHKYTKIQTRTQNRFIDLLSNIIIIGKNEAASFKVAFSDNITIVLKIN